jgi:predicted nucleic acid-binding protein
VRLVIDTSVVVGELFRASGRERLAAERLELFLPERMWNEAQVELPRRAIAYARAHRLPADLRDAMVGSALDALSRNVTVIDAAVYGSVEHEARLRCARDQGDWPVVASALVLSAAIWTNDNDFLGTGVATWTTETLRRWLEHPDP